MENVFIFFFLKLHNLNIFIHKNVIYLKHCLNYVANNIIRELKLKKKIINL